MGAERVHDRVRRAADPGGQDRRPSRPSAHVPRWFGCVHRGVDGVRSRSNDRDPHRVPDRAGRWCGDVDPVIAGIGDASLPRRQGAPRCRDLGCGWRGRRSPWPDAGCDDRRTPRLALGVLHQSPDRPVHRRGRHEDPA